MSDLLLDIGSLVLKTEGFVPPHLFFFHCGGVENFVCDLVELVRDPVGSFFLGADQFIVVGLCGRSFLVRLGTEVFEKFRSLEKFFEFTQDVLLDLGRRNSADSAGAFSFSWVFVISVLLTRAALAAATSELVAVMTFQKIGQQILVILPC